MLVRIIELLVLFVFCIKQTTHPGTGSRVDALLSFAGARRVPVLRHSTIGRDVSPAHRVLVLDEEVQSSGGRAGEDREGLRCTDARGTGLDHLPRDVVRADATGGLDPEV